MNQIAISSRPTSCFLNVHNKINSDIDLEWVRYLMFIFFRLHIIIVYIQQNSGLIYEEVVNLSLEYVISRIYVLTKKHTIHQVHSGGEVR